ncbi:MAG: 3-oxoacyl-[acyl-carrier-protein] reductase [Peptococcaceae bacterium]|jgi:3-oxoacyl-[acyl-carrier protein] reductase|nr:3-oxoacyl-[acyl-carrier-protein] reductase [Peptococcaceae bacterium]
MSLNGKVALVTGAARGLGRAIALQLAAAGAQVMVNYAGSEDKAKEVVRLIQERGGEAELCQADISQAADVERLVKTVMNKYEKIDILINNAGITRDRLLLRMTEEDWDAVLSTNLKGVFLCTKAVSKSMLKQRSGVIINISSIVGIKGNAGQANYAAAKAGVIGLTKATAKEFASRGVRVNAIAPGYIATDMTDILPAEMKNEILKEIPLGKIGVPEDVAQAVLFLVSPAGAYITGQTLSIDGGMSI